MWKPVCAISGDNIGRCVANAHTIFKVFQVIILFPFAEGLVNLIVPGEDKKAGEKLELQFIGKNAVFSPNTRKCYINITNILT